MKAYPEYKDSGVAWIGRVPRHWERYRLKFTGQFGNGLTYSPQDVRDKGVCVLRSTNIQGGKLSFDDNVYVAECPDKLKVEIGDIIICSRNGSANLVGKCALVEESLNATFGAFMMRYRPYIQNKFAYYLFSVAYQQYRGLFATTTINQLTMTAISQMEIVIPPLSEQLAMASYLDRVTAEIDRAIGQQQRMIDLLTERKQIIIQRTVTRGLDPNATMKDSGVEWIGEVPEHWKLLRFRFLSKISTGDSDTQDAEPDGQYPFYVRSPQIERSSKYTCEGDAILMAGDGAGAGRVFHHVNGKYAVHQRMNMGSAQSTVPSVRLHMIQDFLVCVPPLSEQQAIAEYLDRATAKIDAAIARQQKMIDLLTERKQIIVSEVVTGRINVSNGEQINTAKV